MMATDRKLHTTTIARMRGVSDRMVRKWIKDQGLPAERTAGSRGHWRVRESALKEWLAERKAGH